jgi:hypothetical protein
LFQRKKIAACERLRFYMAVTPLADQCGIQTDLGIQDF